MIGVCKRQTDHAVQATSWKPKSTGDPVGDFVAAVARALVDQASRVRVRALEGRQTTLLELKVAPTDFGQVVGKEGRTLAAMETLLKAMSGAWRRRYRLELLDPGRPRGADTGGEEPKGCSEKPTGTEEPEWGGAVEEACALLVQALDLLLDAPGESHVRVVEGQTRVIFELEAAPEDRRHLLGVGGRSISALRHLIHILGVRSGRHFQVTLVG